jgi:two-component system, NtrC family, sensor kinase
MKVMFHSILFICVFSIMATGQNSPIDSLERAIASSAVDSNRVKLVLKLADKYYFTKPDSCLLYAEQALDLSRSLHLVNSEITSLNYAGEALRFLGDYPRALKMQMAALELNKKKKDKLGEAACLGYIGFVYVEFREYRLSLQYLLPSLEIAKKFGDQLKITFDLSNIGNAYDMLRMPDSAIYYQRLAIESYRGLGHGPLKSLLLTRYGNAWMNLGNKDSALRYYHTALRNAISAKDGVNKPKIERKIAEMFETTGQYDSSLYYARQSFTDGQKSTQSLEIFEVSKLLVKLFRRNGNFDSAFFYQDIGNEMSDRLYGPEKFKQLQLLMLQEQERQQAVLQEQQDFRNKIKYIALLAVLGIFFLLAFILVRANRQKQKANTLLRQQKNKIEETLDELKTTQKQLIQSEKMASLGELTAGIAHEIQNPLNFVNNFSEVNAELIDELQQELATGNQQKAIDLANEIKENEQKISHHGKRADGIVKGMLLHSRTSSGQKELTDMNKLADEYLRLAYHGLRAKEKSFNAKFETDFDENIGKINVVPQDIGRVILNLVNNAFYAVNEKRNQYENGYEPNVKIVTRKLNGKIEVTVMDNGNGIPKEALDRIFQPFFTMKPAGKGTGLGLSLSYDIIKSHGGEFKVETKEGEYTTFTFDLPA